MMTTEPPQAMPKRRWFMIAEQAPRHQREPARSISMQRFPQLRPGATVPMPADGRRLVHDVVARRENASEELVIPTRARRSACIERLVEAAEVGQHAAAHSHIGAGPDRSDRQTIVRGALEYASAEAAAERAVPLE